jgi:hypothetical protein
MINKQIVAKFLLSIMAVAMTASAGFFLSQSNLWMTLFTIFGGTFCMTGALSVDSFYYEELP